MISGTTRLAGVIGHPVAHSLSPALHNAGFASLRLDWVYLAFDVAAGETAAALVAMRAFGLGGLSVTMPHKEAVAAAVDVLDPAAAALRSVNTVVRLADGRLAGHSTDGDGFVAALVAAGHPVDGRAFCVLGAGGAARSIVEALARNRAGSVVVVNRSAGPAAAAVRLAGRIGRVGETADVTAADVVVNATSVGMGSRELPVPAQRLRCGQVVVDIVYHPRRTALLEAAEAIGATIVDGLGMLVHQAALQQALWTGRTPDITAMADAAEHELGRRESAAR